MLNFSNLFNNNRNNNLGELRAANDQFNDGKKLALIISRHTGDENMRIHLEEIRKELNEHHNGLFTAMVLSFDWQGNVVELSEDYDFETLAKTIILSFNGEKLARIFWSVNAGLTALHFRHLTKAENWFLSNVIINSVWDWSHTSGRLISLNKVIVIGDIKIVSNDDHTTLMAKIGEEEIPMMGHTLRGNIWWSNDPRLQEVIEVVKKAFTKPF